MRNIGKKKNSKIKEALQSHIKNNLKEYLIVIIIFLIGLVFGIVFINNTGQTQILEISTYFTEFINNLKNNMQIDKIILLKNSIVSNVILAIAFWFIGSTVIGTPLLYALVTYRGFCLGYTISSGIVVLGLGKRNYIFYIIDVFAEHNIYSCNICLSSKSE